MSENQPVLNITKKQKEILILFFRFRYLTIKLIQKLLNHKDPRRIKEWMSDLKDKKIVDRNYNRKFGNDGKPAIYFLVNNARKVILETNEFTKTQTVRIYRDKSRSARLVAHCIEVVNFYQNIHDSLVKADIAYTYYSKPELANFDYLFRPLPDGFLVLKQKCRKRFFIEIIDLNTPLFVIRNRIKQYYEYFESGEWENGTGFEFPSAIIVLKNSLILNSVKQIINQFAESESENLEFKLLLSNQPLDLSDY